MNSTRFDPAMYAMQLQVAYARAMRSPGPYIVAIGWALFPFAVQTVLHPSDVIRLQAVMQGLDKPHLFTHQQLTSGLVQAVFALAVLVLVQLCGTTLFYRRVQMSVDGGRQVAVPTLWPLALFLTGILGNAAWLIGTGQFDATGCLVGMSSVVLAVGAEWVVEGLGRRFVFGPATGAHPPIPQSW